MKVMVTGANGFIGTALAMTLEREGWQVTRAVRQAARPTDVAVGDIGMNTDWRPALSGAQAVVHLAARVHVMNGDNTPGALDECRRVNALGAFTLARQAAASGIRRFVFMSTAKVHGEGRAVAYRETDAPAPEGAYAVSKWEAERGLREIAAATGMELVILRPPLVYGPGVGANFRRLMRLAASGLPLPFAAIDNRRSLVFTGNLTDAVRQCLTHERAAGKTYLLSDGEDVSTPELFRRMARAMGTACRLFPVPAGWLALAARGLGRQEDAARLLGSLTVDGAAMRRDLHWSPPFGLDRALAATAEKKGISV